MWPKVVKIHSSCQYQWLLCVKTQKGSENSKYFKILLAIAFARRTISTLFTLILQSKLGSQSDNKKAINLWGRSRMRAQVKVKLIQSGHWRSSLLTLHFSWGCMYWLHGSYKVVENGIKLCYPTFQTYAVSDCCHGKYFSFKLL